MAVANSGSRPSLPICSTESMPSTNSPRGRVEHGQVEALGVHGVDLRLRVPAPRLGRGVDAVVLLLPPGLATVDVRRSGRAEPQHDVVLDPHAHVAGISARPRRRGVGVGRIDVALPEVGRLHHVQVAVADDVVAQSHRPPVDPTRF